MEQAKTELQLTQYQNKAITDTLCWLVVEQGRPPNELPDFRRALMEECLAMNAKTSDAVLAMSLVC